MLSKLQFSKFIKSTNSFLNLDESYASHHLVTYLSSIEFYSIESNYKKFYNLLNYVEKPAQVSKFFETKTVEEVLQLILMLELSQDVLISFEKEINLNSETFQKFLPDLIIECWSYFRENYNSEILRIFENSLTYQDTEVFTNVFENSLVFQIIRFNYVLSANIQLHSETNNLLKNFFKNYLNAIEFENNPSKTLITWINLACYYPTIRINFRHLSTSIGFLNLFINYRSENSINFNIKEFLKTQDPLHLSESYLAEFSFEIGNAIKAFDYDESDY